MPWAAHWRSTRPVHRPLACSPPPPASTPLRSSACATAQRPRWEAARTRRFATAAGTMGETGGIVRPLWAHLGNYCAFLDMLRSGQRLHDVELAIAVHDVNIRIVGGYEKRVFDRSRFRNEIRRSYDKIRRRQGLPRPKTAERSRQDRSSAIRE